LEAPNGTSGQFVVPAGTPEQLLLDGQTVVTTSISSTERGLTGLPPGRHTIEVEVGDDSAS